MLRQDATDYILVDLDTERMRNLLGDLSATEAWITSFHFNDSGNQFLRRSFGTGATTSSRSTQPPVFVSHQRLVKPG